MLSESDKSALRARLRDYLVAKGVKITRDNLIPCFQPEKHAHGDQHPSAVVYEENVYCPVCATSKGCGTWDVFEAAGFLGGARTFPEKLEEIQRTLNIVGETDGKKSRTNNPAKKQGREYNNSGDRNKVGQADHADAGRKPPVAVPLPVARAKKLYTSEALTAIAARMKTPPQGPLVRVWTYKDEVEQVIGVDGRFEWEESVPVATGGSDQPTETTDIGLKAKKKAVITYFYDGERVRSAGAPVMLYGRDQLAAHPDLSVVIHEGAKCAQAAAVIPGFVHISWSGGAAKAGMADWSPLKGRTVIIYPDADEPGYRAANKIKEELDAIQKSDPQGANSGLLRGNGREGNIQIHTGDPRVTIRTPLQEAVERYGAGADIVEALQVRTPDELAEYLRSGPELAIERQDDETARGAERRAPEGLQYPQDGDEEPEHPPLNDSGEAPFRILGIADDKRGYFLSTSGRLYAWQPETLNKDKLNTLAPLSWWSIHYPQKHGVDWDTAIDDVRRTLDDTDFSLDSLRGRGAWKNDTPDGTAYLYWDGQVLSGGADPAHTYIRCQPRSIGIDAAPASPETRAVMLHAADLLSFETKADIVRILGWAVLAPFGGALSWRPAGFLTGDSGSGKSTIFDLIVKPLARLETQSDICTGSESSGAGVRQHDPFDSLAIGVEESDSDDETKKRNVKEIVSIMRVSTSDDTPPAWKGTQNQGGLRFQLRRMFIFLAIDNSIGDVADRKRFFYVNTQRPQDSASEWAEKKAILKSAFSVDDCRAVRAFTWAHLAEIISFASELSGPAGEIGHNSTRYAFLEAMLFSAFWRVFKDRFPEPAEAREWLTKLYDAQAPERIEDEPEVMLNRIFAEVVQIDGDYKKHETLGKILIIIKNRSSDGEDSLNLGELLPYKKTALFWGLYVNSAGQVCIFRGNPYLEKILGTKEYQMKLRRHPACVEKDKTVNPGSGNKAARAVILSTEVLATDDLPF
jgi:hypothetical protein